MAVKSGVSVVVPTYNADRFLETCLESVARQTYGDVAIVVVDDGSTDDTVSVARRYVAKVVTQENAGPSVARNRGVQLATTPLIAFLDADDFWEPTFLERCIDFLDACPEVAAVSTGLRFRLGNGTERIEPRALMTGEAESGPIVLNSFFRTWALHDHVRTGSAVFRKDVLNEAGSFREDLRVAEDLELWGYIGTLGKWGFVPEPLWVGNSVPVAAGNWREKQRSRARWCPTVEQWEARLADRIEPEDRRYFEVVRGKVAAAYAYSKVLAGDWEAVRHIVGKYGREMPKNKLTWLLGVGSGLGAIGRIAVSSVVTTHEAMKAVRLRRFSGPNA